MHTDKVITIGKTKIFTHLGNSLLRVATNNRVRGLVATGLTASFTLTGLAACTTACIPPFCVVGYVGVTKSGVNRKAVSLLRGS